MRTGHVPVNTTLRAEEIPLLDELVAAANVVDPWHRRTGRAGVTRASVRFALEHREAFLRWVTTETEQGLDGR